jgi:diguanylate cyclase
MINGSYNIYLVIASLVVAILASYTALGMAERVYLSQNAKWWRLGGAFAMGVGIWSMHFIGMLAFSLPIDLGYDLGLTLGSLLVAIVVSYFALWEVSQQTLSTRRLILGAILMGAGIVTMHYMGMAAMRMLPAIQYKTDVVILSVLIAMLASGAALYIILWLRSRSKHVLTTHLLAACVMGMAIAGTHYTGMWAAEFRLGSVCQAAGNGLSLQALTTLVSVSSLCVLLIANITSIFDSKAAYLIRSLEAANLQLKEQVLYDNLTKLPNRVLLEERVKQVVAQSIHQGLSFVLLQLDLDGFKAINDSMGSHVGDNLLVEIAKRIRLTIPAQNTVARTAGNEFVVVLEQIEARNAAIVVENLIASIIEPLMIDDTEIMVTASIGMAVFPSDGVKYEELIFRADAAMQHTKKSGKNGYHYFEASMDRNASSKMEMIAHLRHAIERNELVLHYQAKLDASTGYVIGAEALLRWMHPKLGFVPPDQFIPLAEEHGLIISIGDWVLDQACRQMHLWNEQGYTGINVSVNLSPTQFSHTDLYQQIVASLSKWSLSASQLTLEVTETTAMHNVDESLKILEKIANLGVKVSIDDFGTGYSSLLYLKRLPADELKIDRGFVNFLGIKKEDDAIVSVIINLGHQFGLKVVAEGLETEQQKQLLTKLGCDIFQGYLLGRPKAPQQFIADHRESIKVNRDFNKSLVEI